MISQQVARNTTHARLAVDHHGIAAGAAVTVVWVRSFLSRPRVYGGRIQHEFVAVQWQPYRKVIVTDRQLEHFNFVGEQIKA